MNLPRLEIHSTPCRIAIRTENAKIEVEGEEAQLRIRQRPAQLQITREEAELVIDQSSCFATSGLKPILQLSLEHCNQVKAKVIDSIGEMAERGWRLMNIHKGENIGRIEFERMLNSQRPLREVTMPAERPKTTIKPSKVNIDWTPQEVDIYWEPGDRRIVVTPGGVTIYVSQYPAMEITLIEGEIGDPEHFGEPAGRNVDVAL